jgi:hypothetical protein
VIAKVTRTADAGALLRYLFGAGKAKEYSDRHVVTVAEGTVVRTGVALAPAEVRDLAGQLDVARRLFGTQVGGGHVWHLCLANGPADRELSDGEWAGVVNETVGRLGFSSAPGQAPCAWVAVRLRGPGPGRDYVHVVVSLVREDGTIAPTWRDRVVLSEACADFERHHGLAVVGGRRRPALGRRDSALGSRA